MYYKDYNIISDRLINHTKALLNAKISNENQTQVKAEYINDAASYNHLQAFRINLEA